MKRTILFIIIVLSIVITSCTPENYKRDTSINTSPELKLISDAQFIENLNSFKDSVRIIDQICNIDTRSYTIIVESNDSIFAYSGRGTIMKHFFTDYNVNELIK